jgi:hypothetical protein
MFAKCSDQFSFCPVIDLITPTVPMLDEYFDVVLARIGVAAPLATDPLGCLFGRDSDSVVNLWRVVHLYCISCVIGYNVRYCVLFHAGSGIITGLSR